MKLIQALINQGFSYFEAFDLIKEARADVAAGANPYEILEGFGVEEDYLMEILP